MIDITLYRARIGLHSCTQCKKKKDPNTNRKFYPGSITGGIIYMGFHPIFILYLTFIIYIAAICMSMLCDIPVSHSQFPIMQLHTGSIIAWTNFTANIKLWYIILFSRACIQFYRMREFKFHKRHVRILAYSGILFTFLNFLLITIVNPSLLNPGPKNLDVFYQNVQGFIPFKDLSSDNPSLNFTKIFEFQNFISDTKPAAIILNETWLKPSIRDTEILPNSSYNVFRLDRSPKSHPPDVTNPSLFKRSGGGVLMAIRNDLNVASKVVKLKCGAEILTLKLSVDNGMKIYLCTCYRVGTLGQANHAEIDRYLNSLYRLDKKFVRVFVIGDLNLSNVNWPSFISSSPVEQDFLNSFNNLGFKQLITEPTHKYGNTLDVLLTNSEQSVNNLKVLDIDSIVKSDHNPITFDISFNIKKKKPVKRKIYNFKRANWDELNRDLFNVDWNSILINSSSEHAWSIFNSKLFELCNKHIPVITIRSEFQPPWFDSECHNLCRKKERLRTKYKRTKSDDHYVKFSNCRREFKKLVQAKMRDNLIDIEDDPALIPKKFWTYVKSSSNSHRIPECMNYKSRFRTNRQEQCELFNEFFYRQFSSPSLYNIDINFSGDSMSEFIIHQNTVFRILSDIKTNKAQGPDKIHGKVLKECATSLAYPLSVLFNMCFKSGQLPCDWKTANIVPIFKKGSKTDIENYRPISLTSLVMKVFERIIRDELYLRCEQYLDRRQHGFLPKRSCTTLMVDYCDSLALSLNSGIETDVVYFDFSKAFDTVNHDILLHKLKNMYKIDGHLLRFIACYLKGRKQRVVIGNCEASLRNVDSGVPQGSILGPLLFVLFINDLPAGLSPETNAAMYADDTKIWRQIHTLADCYILQNDIDYMQNWAVENKMKFNSTKCKVLQVSLRRTNPLLDCLPFSKYHYMLDFCFLDFTSSENDLGVNITRKLNWNEQCTKLISKASQMFGLTRRTAHFVSNPRQRRALYLALVRSQFEHCSVIWRPHCKTAINKLENLQKRCLKWILSEEFLHYSSDIYFQKCKSLDILPLGFRLLLNDLVLFHKIFYSLSPVTLPIYLSKFTGNSLRSSHYDSLSVVSNIIPRINASSSSVSSFQPFAMSFFYRTHSSWNNLPFNIRNISCPRTFKLKVTEILWSDAYRHFQDKVNNSIDSHDNSLYDDGG